MTRNHSCSANTRVVVGDSLNMEVYSQLEIPPGQELTISYLPSIFLTLPERQDKLKATWFFHCDCSR